MRAQTELPLDADTPGAEDDPRSRQRQAMIDLQSSRTQPNFSTQFFQGVLRFDSKPDF
jgi:hypothetical protein